jgi:hypothetical protein
MLFINSHFKKGFKIDEIASGRFGVKYDCHFVLVQIQIKISSANNNFISFIKTCFLSHAKKSLNDQLWSNILPV